MDLDAGQRRRLKFLAGFTVYFVAVWALWGTPVIYPLKIFVVLLHEASHAVAALGTGGTVEAIEITPDQGGVCYTRGGNAFVILSAGYLGSLAWGLLLLAGARGRGPWIRPIVGVIGAAVLGLTLFYVRNLFGIVFGILFAGGLLASMKYLSIGVNRVLLTALGLTSALYAIFDIKSDILDRSGIRSDASMLAELTGIPTVAWGILWIAVAILVSGWFFRRSFERA